MVLKINETVELLKGVTPPSEIPSPKQVEYFSQLIKDNPQDLVNKGIIDKVKKQWPSQLGSVLPSTSESIANLGKSDLKSFQQRMSQYKKHTEPCLPSAIDTIGNTIIFADPCKDNFFAKSEAYLENFFNNITKTSSFAMDLPGEIKGVTKQLGSASQLLVGKIGNKLTDEMVKFSQQGMTNVADRIFSNPIYANNRPAALAKVIQEQTALVGPINDMFNSTSCLTTKVGDALQDSISDMLVGMAKNVLNPSTCAVQQMIGGITNKIGSEIDDAVAPFTAPLEKAFGIAFNVKEVAMGGIQLARKTENLFNCGQKPKCPASSKYKIGSGTQRSKSQNEQQGLLDQAFSAAQTASSLVDKAQGAIQGVGTQLSNFEKEYGQWEIFGSKINEAADHGIGQDCYTGNIFKCGAPKVEFFGGDGIGGAGKVLLGNFIDKIDPEDIYGTIKKTGGILGVKMSDRGNGYTEEPMIAFSDNCNQGYGAYGKAVIDKNINSPTYGQIIDIIITGTGINYPVEEVKPLYVSNVIIENPGNNYSDDDVIDDPNLELVITDGQVTGVNILAQEPFEILPSIDIISSSGYGAVILPVMSDVKITTEVVLNTSIDCIGNYTKSGE